MEDFGIDVEGKPVVINEEEQKKNVQKLLDQSKEKFR